MDTRHTPNTDQRAGVRPIAFLLDDQGVLSSPVYLSIRPEDLTKTEPSRVAVHQTLGRGGAQGWVDNFGEGLPSVNISGHTGWRTSTGSGLDGAEAFDELNQLVAHDYYAAKRVSIESGIDPAGVKLLYVDTLNGISWSVVPTQFVLRRSKSRPLLYQYNISLQALSTSVDDVELQPPDTGSFSNGLIALRRAGGVLGGIEVGGALGDVVDVVGGAIDVVGTIGDVISSAANAAGSLAFKAAQAALSAHRVLLRTTSVPFTIAQNGLLLAQTLNEIACLFSNSLRPRSIYEQYSGLLGASNCSSTTGGSAPSSFAGTNVFSQMFDDPRAGPRVSGEALASMTALQTMDPVLSPLPEPEVNRHLVAIAGGVTF